MRVSYYDRMNAFRGRAPHAAMVLTPKAQPPRKTPSAPKPPAKLSSRQRDRMQRPPKQKPLPRPVPLLAVNRSYSRWRALEADLIRHYEACSVSKSAKRFEGSRRKAYCAGVAWKIVRASGKYTDYPAFQKKETAVMKGKKKKGASKKSAARKTKTPKKSAAKSAAAKKAAKTRQAKHEARSKAAKKAARTRKKNEKRKTKAPKRSAAKTAAKKPTRAKAKTPRKSTKRSKAAKKAARTRKRNQAERSASAKKAARTKKRSSGGARRPKKKVNVNIPGIRVVGGKPQTTNVKLTISREALARRRAGKKRGGSRPRKSAAVYESGSAMVMENPMSGGEFLVAGAAVGVGVLLSDAVNRWVMTRGAAKAYANQAAGDNSDGPPATASTKGTWLGYGDAVSAPMNVWAMLAQGGLIGASVGGAWFFDNRHVRAGFQGLALGAIGNVVKEVVVDFVLIKFFGIDKAGSPRPMLNRLYPYQLNASIIDQNLVKASSSGTGTQGLPPSAGQPTGVGRPRPYGARFFQDPGPRAAAAAPTGVGDVVPRGGDAPRPAPTPPRSAGQGGGDVPRPAPTPPALPPTIDTGVPPMGGCGGPPCSTQSYGEQAALAYREGVQDAGSCGCEGEAGMGRVPVKASTGVGRAPLPLFGTTFEDAAAE